MTTESKPKKPTARQAGPILVDTKTPERRRAVVLAAMGDEAHKISHWTQRDFDQFYWSMTSGVIHEAAMGRQGGVR